MKKSRVKIPVYDSKAVMDLVMKIREQHVADGDASPLNVLNWNELNPEIDAAAAVVAQAEKLKQEKLMMFDERKQRMEAMRSFIRSTRDILAGFNDSKMRRLQRWGFDVVQRKASESEATNAESEKNMS